MKFIYFISLFFINNNIFSQQYLTLNELEKLSLEFNTPNELNNLQYIFNPKGYLSTYKDGKIFSDHNYYIDPYKNELHFYSDETQKVMLRNFIEYKLNNPSKEILSNLFNDLKNNYQKYTLGKTEYFTKEGKAIIEFRTKIEKGKNVAELIIWNNLSKGWLVPAKVISKNKIEVNSFTERTNIFLNENDTVYLKSNGTIRYGAWAGSGNPDGIDGYSSYSKEPSLKHGSLIGKIQSVDKWYFIGTYKSFVVRSSGYLWLEVNDLDPSNNDGSYIIEYSISKYILPD